MSKVGRALSRLGAGAPRENSQRTDLVRDLERVGAELTQLRGVVFAHRELMRHALETVSPAFAEEIESSYHLCRLSEDWLKDVGESVEQVIRGVMQPENAHG